MTDSRQTDRRAPGMGWGEVRPVVDGPEMRAIALSSEECPRTATRGSSNPVRSEGEENVSNKTNNTMPEATTMTIGNLDLITETIKERTDANDDSYRFRIVFASCVHVDPDGTQKLDQNGRTIKQTIPMLEDRSGHFDARPIMVIDQDESNKSEREVILSGGAGGKSGASAIRKNLRARSQDAKVKAFVKIAGQRIYVYTARQVLLDPQEVARQVARAAVEKIAALGLDPAELVNAETMALAAK